MGKRKAEVQEIVTGDEIIGQVESRPFVNWGGDRYSAGSVIDAQSSISSTSLPALSSPELWHLAIRFHQVAAGVFGIEWFVDGEYIAVALKTVVVARVALKTVVVARVALKTVVEAVRQHYRKQSDSTTGSGPTALQEAVRQHYRKRSDSW